MRETFEHKLGKLNNDLIRMGGMIEEAIASAITALRDSDAVLAKKVVDGDRAVDEEEKNIESQCLSIILREQPVARDLRKVSAALKMVTDMERIADNAADIAEISLTADVSAIMHIVKEIQTMSEKVIIMVSHSIDSFVTTDINLSNKQDKFRLDQSCSMDVSTVRNNTRYINRGTDKMPEIVQPTKEQ